MLHLLENPRYAFAHFLQITEIRQHTYDQRVARKVDAPVLTQLFEAYGRRRKTGAAHFNPIIKHPDLDGGARDSIIPVRDRIDQSFLPSKSGILESLSEKQVVEHCPLPDVFFDPTHSFINEAREGASKRMRLTTFRDVPCCLSVPSYLTKSMPQRGCQKWDL